MAVSIIVELDTIMLLELLRNITNFKHVQVNLLLVVKTQIVLKMLLQYPIVWITIVSSLIKLILKCILETLKIMDALTKTFQNASLLLILQHIQIYISVLWIELGAIQQLIKLILHNLFLLAVIISQLLDL